MEASVSAIDAENNILERAAGAKKVRKKGVREENA
jgi:hypothetical protein